jgi:hypothetical protein
VYLAKKQKKMDTNSLKTFHQYTGYSDTYKKEFEDGKRESFSTALKRDLNTEK